MTNFLRVGIPFDLLAKMPFSCACNYSGCLEQIKQHLERTAIPEVCFNKRSSATQPPRQVTQTARQATPASHARSAPSNGSPAVLLTQIAQSIAELKTVNETLRSLLDESQAVIQAVSTNQVFFCFSLSKLLKREPVEQSKVVEGVPLTVQINVEGLEDRPYFCVSVGGSALDSETSPWPHKDCISVRVHDMNGRIVLGWKIPSFAGGMRGSPPETSGPRTSKYLCEFSHLVSEEDILRHYPRTRAKYILISLVICERLSYN
ncbi:uncharacterized protein LOC114828161 [Galendromus occidentalis]|uniref:Uncharacterized protein LOC114828161 n=1 Tax=Galendromus occidentalis TaxID=34638 RepID=A0AAJ7SF61_9ACAR|nr:uncharacterized protein LOC114828161 [Galendromus occidentalis]